MSLTHVPLKKTGFQVRLCATADFKFVRTADAMLLHGGNFLEREARCIYHEGEFRRVDFHELVVFYGDNEKDKKYQIAGRD